MFNSSLFTPPLLRTHSLVFFAVHKTRRIFLSPFISKVSRYVSSFFLVSSFLSSTWLQATLALSLILSSLKLVCSDFSTFFAAMPRSSVFWLLFNLVWNSVVYSPSSVIRDPSYHRQFVLLGVYWPGSEPLALKFFDELSMAFEQLVSYNCSVVVCGDFNVHFDLHDDRNTMRLREMLRLFGFVQHMCVVTHSIWSSPRARRTFSVYVSEA